MFFEGLGIELHSDCIDAQYVFAEHLPRDTEPTVEHLLCRLYDESEETT